MRVSSLDVASMIVTAVGLAWAVVTVLVLQPRFGSMFADFGAELPAATRLWLQPVTAWLWALAPMVVVVGNVVINTRPPVRIVSLIAVILVTLAQVGFFFLAAYAPIFELSSTVAP